MKFALRSGAKTVTTAGTRVALSTTAVWARQIRLVAPAGNAGNVFVGDVTVAASNGVALAPGAILPLADLLGDNLDKLAAIDLSKCYVDAATNGDKLTFCYFEPVL